MNYNFRSGLIILISAVLLSCRSAHYSKTDNSYKNEDNLRGKVKSVLVITYSAEEVSGKLREKEITEKELLQYDEKGRSISSMLEVSGESPYSYNTFYTHDSKGNLTEVRTATSSGDTLISFENYEYDDKNNKVLETVFEPGTGDTITYEYRYNAEGKPVQRDESRQDGTSGKMLYEYAGGMVSEEKTYDENGSMVSRTVYTYEEEGKVTRSTTFRWNGTEEKSSMKRVDDKGNVTEMVEINNESKWKSLFQYTYDQYGNVLTSSLTTSIDNEKPSVSISSYDREYDKAGNWTLVRIKSANGFGIVRRVFEYYR